MLNNNDWMKELEVIPVRVAKGSGNIIATLHYSLDPQKDPKTPSGKIWVDEQKRKFAAQQLRDPTLGSFNQEMEIIFEQFSGRPVISSAIFSKMAHTAHYPGVDKERELIVGFDFGGRNPAVFFSQTDIHARWIWHQGIKYDGIGLHTICQQIKASFNDRESMFYNEKKWKIRLICDVSGTYENNQGITDEKGLSKAAQILQDEFGLIPEARKIDIKDSVKGLNAMFEQMVTIPQSGLDPAIGLTTKICVNPSSKFLLDLILGGWHYKTEPPGTTEIEKDGIYIHVGDIIRYVYEHVWRNKHIQAVDMKEAFVSTFTPKLLH